MAVRDLPAAGSRALDIGCGGGWDSIFLAQCGFAVTGIDVSPKAYSWPGSGRWRQEFRWIFDREMPWTCRWKTSRSTLRMTGTFSCDPGGGPISLRPRSGADFEAGWAIAPPGLPGTVPRDEEKHGKMGDSHEPDHGRSLDRLFPAEGFLRGPVLPIRLMGEKGRGMAGQYRPDYQEVTRKTGLRSQQSGFSFCG